MSKIMYMDNEYAGFSLTTDFDTPETVTFPFTATSGGILSATVVPSTSSTSYIYVVDNLSTSYRFASSGGLSYQMTIPIVKGRTYSISASSNYAINGTIKFYPFKSTPSTRASDDITKVTITPAKGTSYANWDGCYYETMGRWVHLHFGLSGLTQNAGNTVYTLPEELRPSTLRLAIGGGQSTQQYSQLHVQVSGACIIYPIGSQYSLVDMYYFV